MISVRSRRTTYLCLDDDSYTGFYTGLNRVDSLQLISPCFVVYLLPQSYFTISGFATVLLSSLFVPAKPEWRFLWKNY